VLRQLETHKRASKVDLGGILLALVEATGAFVQNKIVNQFAVSPQLR
jgi:hypothetical protein